jgi:hypothetical protein
MWPDSRVILNYQGQPSLDAALYFSLKTEKQEEHSKGGIR